MRKIDNDVVRVAETNVMHLSDAEDGVLEAADAVLVV